MANWLKSKINISKDYMHEMFAYKSKFERPLKEIINDELATFNLNNKEIGIVQLEMINVEEFLNQNLNDIKIILEYEKKANSLEFIFLTMIDIEKGFNKFVVIDNKSLELVKNVLNAKFQKDVAKRNGIIMRKEIVPLINKYLQLNNNLI